MLVLRLLKEVDRHRDYYGRYPQQFKENTAQCLFLVVSVFFITASILYPFARVIGLTSGPATVISLIAGVITLFLMCRNEGRLYTRLRCTLHLLEREKFVPSYPKGNEYKLIQSDWTTCISYVILVIILLYSILSGCGCLEIGPKPPPIVTAIPSFLPIQPLLGWLLLITFALVSTTRFHPIRAFYFIYTDILFKPMNIKLLLRAMKYMLLPTLSVIGFLMFAFFSFTEPFVFLAGSSTSAIVSRIGLLLLEAGLVLYMYSGYVNEEKVKEIESKVLNDDKLSSLKFRETSCGERLRDIFKGYDSSNDEYSIAETPMPNVKIIRVIRK